MPRSLDQLIEEVGRKHFPCAPARLPDIREAERELGFELPFDLREFYLRCNGAKLFKRDDPTYFVLPIEKIKRARIDICGEDDDKWGPAYWYSFCDVQDGDYVAFDARTIQGAQCWIIDCFHETFAAPGYNTIIALSFIEFLEQALKSSPVHFWLKDQFADYGDALQKPLT